MKRHLSESDVEQDYDSAECSSPDVPQEQVTSRKQRRGIIEKRRRDRINNCLLELRRLVPAAFEKQGSAKLEKAEILQMTVDHLRHLHQSTDARGFPDPLSAYSNTKAFLDYRLMGYKECVGEASRFLTTMEGIESGESLRVRLLAHLETYLAQRELAINAAVASSTSQSLGTGNAGIGPAATPPIWAFPPPTTQALLAASLMQQAGEKPPPQILPNLACLLPTVGPFVSAPPTTTNMVPPVTLATQPTNDKPQQQFYRVKLGPPPAKMPFRPWLTKEEAPIKN